MTISISIPVISGAHLRECLDSIFQSSFQEFEVVVNDSSGNPVVSDILKDYDVRTIERKSKSFESRYITTMASKGGRVFIFDETRVMEKKLLEDVNNRNNDMLVIIERDIGKGIVNYFSNLDKTNIPNDLSILDPMRNKSVIPRVYKREIIVSALETVRKNLPEDILSQVVGLDLELIYLESYNLTKDIGFISSSEMMHYGDESIREVFRKYYRYGYTQRMLKNTYYGKFAGLSGRNRSTLPVKNRIKSIPVQVLRGVPFVLGYLGGNNKRGAK
jgi:hypothetical protein